MSAHYRTVVIGGGPSGTGPLVYGAWSGRLPELLGRGLALVEGSDSLCAGRLGHYQINSNSTGATFVECLEHGTASPFLRRSLEASARARVAEYRDRVLPLPLAGELLDEIGRDLQDAFAQFPESKVFLGTHAEQIRIVMPSQFEITLRDTRSHELRRVSCQRVLMATGGNAHVPRRVGAALAAAARRNGAAESPLMMSSDRLLQADGLRAAQAWLDGYDAPVVAIVGGSHSAFASAGLLLKQFGDDLLAEHGAIALLARAAPKLFYDTCADAAADGYAAYADADVGKRGQVYPIAGLRGDAKDLYRAMIGLGGCGPEPRVRLLELPSCDAAYDAVDVDWERLALVVFASGYTMPEVPIVNARGAPVSLHGHYTDVYVDQQSRLLDATGAPLPGLYAVGLATGFSPVEMLGGESTYSGKENSVWLCQHMLGETLFDALARD
ncbi:FAD-binding protein [Xanthomonas bonasiae]|uniref:FAD-binding protein n=1 Tax=Xanthomonas bonasiae TaxID=2810351 RepID=UPI00197F6EC9|nr:FAD-binding protein [Xanthomonas bonasiae]MBN6111423.1 FAD-binding protein [Xanthomonas bonasiae]